MSNIIADAGNTLSSWDNCMAKAYCKWPVIVAIIVGGLIILSLVLCLVRCCCCGLECCCGCFACCNACCPGPRSKKRDKYHDSPPQPYYPHSGQPNPYNQQYRSPTSPQYGSSKPQFATFDAHPNEDALPAMPSWDNAASKKVQVQHDPESHELSPLNPPADAHTANGVYGFNPANNNSNRPLSPPSPLDSQFSSSVVTAGGGRYHNGGWPGEGQPGYHGQSTGGYRGAAPAPVSDIGSSVGVGSNVSSYHTPTYSQYYGQMGQPSQQQSYGHHQTTGGQAQTQTQMQMPQEQHYHAYPGQATYGGSGIGNGAEQGYSGSGSGGYGYGNQTRSSPTRGVNAPISQYPQQYRPSQSPIPEPEWVVEQPPRPQQQGQGQVSSVGRRPVEGSWRDV
ncbi:hypothetical protein LTS18_003166 [Coniosporium uncinatum]|uniref:Uncharacterized protein n=1 Tax=Coniosporium uncinatum TaxID=93489 RepID=A0ACC3DTJ3_9PEZI|nr:hypothetical protein LTS18_003166 [Coniosporium uncinatum]